MDLISKWGLNAQKHEGDGKIKACNPKECIYHTRKNEERKWECEREKGIEHKNTHDT